MLTAEADTLADLGRQVLSLHHAVIDGRAAMHDPALARLYPAAYADDADAAEFRRLASADIAADRIRSMTRMVADLEAALPTAVDGDELHIDVDTDGVDAWLRSLGEVRLVLQVRAEQDRAELDPDITDDDLEQLRAIVDWLAFAQQTLLEALD